MADIKKVNLRRCAFCGEHNPSSAGNNCLFCGERFDQRSISVKQTYLSVNHYAGFWKRFAAVLIDEILFQLFAGVFFWFPQLMMVSPPFIFSSFLFNHLIVRWVYFSGMESSQYQATLGKMVLGIMVVDTRGRRISFLKATARYWAKILSMMTFYIGFIMAGFTKEKQALHDIVAECLVVNKNSPSLKYLG